MRRGERWISACGLALVLAGAMVFVFLLAKNGFDWNRFAAAVSDGEYIQRSCEPGADFARIEISGAASDVCLLPSGDGSCRVTWDETAQNGYDVQVRGDTLHITQSQEKENLFRWINVNLHTPVVTVQLPGSEYDAVQIGTASGDVSLQEMEAGRLEISAAGGDVDLRQLQLGSAKIQTTSGDVDLLNVDADAEISIRTAGGDVHLENCDAPALVFSTASGDIFADLKSGKAFDIDTASGDVIFPDGLNENGSFRADTASGDVHVQVREDR